MSQPDNPDSLRNLYCGEPFHEYFDFKEKAVYLEGDTKIMPTKVIRDLGVPVQVWRQAWRSLHHPINGQVKNFLVAVRTLAMHTGSVRVCVRGSKAHQGGGIWHMYFLAYLRHYHSHVHVDFYDLNEIAEVYSSEDGKLTAKWIPRFYEGKGEGYDALVDDAFEEDVVDLVPTVKFFSLKGRQAQKGYVPFLHPSETRFFSTTLVGSQKRCPCAVCRVCSESTTTLAEFQWLRDQCVVLGHPSCNPYDGRTFYVRGNDLQRKGEVLRDLLKSPVVLMEGPSDARAIVTLTEEQHVEIFGSSGRAAINPNYRLVKTQLQYGKAPTGDEVEEVVFRRVEGKNVIFVGVDASILGSTHVRSDLTKPPEIAFCQTVDMALLAVRAPVLYVGGTISSIKRLVNYKATGVKWRSMHELLYVQGPELEVQLGRFYDGEELSPSKMFRRVEDYGPFQKCDLGVVEGRHHLCSAKNVNGVWVLEKGWKNTLKFSRSDSSGVLSIEKNIGCSVCGEILLNPFKYAGMVYCYQHCPKTKIDCVHCKKKHMIVPEYNGESICVSKTNVQQLFFILLDFRKRNDIEEVNIVKAYGLHAKTIYIGYSAEATSLFVKSVRVIGEFNDLLECERLYGNLFWCKCGKYRERDFLPVREVHKGFDTVRFRCPTGCPIQS